jgi:hypothetical protein
MVTLDADVPDSAADGCGVLKHKYRGFKQLAGGGPLCACIGSPCLRQCVHGVSINAQGEHLVGRKCLRTKMGATVRGKITGFNAGGRLPCFHGVRGPC